MSPRTFAAFSKFDLNTSKSPNVKVVYFVERHNFHVEWHLRFGVEMCEKAWSTLRVTIHRRSEICHLGMQFVHNWLRKKPYALCKSCRGMLDLQLSYSNFCALQFNFLEFWSVKQGYTEILRPHTELHTPEHGAPRLARAPPPGTRAMGPTWTPRPHGLHAENTGALDDAPPTSLPHPAHATCSRSPHRPPTLSPPYRSRKSPSPTAHTATPQFSHRLELSY
jgi:hypothetical protein